MTDALLFSTAKREITPPPGKPMAAFPQQRDPMQPRIAEGAHDPLWTRAWAARQGETTAVVCAADVLTFQWPDVDVMRAAFAERTGLTAESLILCGTHNHNGPECTYLFGGAPDDPCIDAMRRNVVEAACEAIAKLAPATVSAASVDVDLSFNRRQVLPDGRFRQRGDNPDRERLGPVDPRVTVLRFDHPDGQPMGAALHFSAHPVIMTTPNRLFTAEYPGAALQWFEREAAVPAFLFLQGPCGDIHPYEAIANDFDAVESMGKSLARAATSAWEQAAPEPELALALDRWKADLPHRYSPRHRVRIEATALRFGPRLAMVFWQGEPFVELSLALQWRSPFARTVVVGYSLGWIGYVPTRQAYDLGGYGVDLYEQDPPQFSRTAVSPGTGEEMVDRTCELLRRLRNDSQRAAQTEPPGGLSGPT